MVKHYNRRRGKSLAQRIKRLEKNTTPWRVILTSGMLAVQANQNEQGWLQSNYGNLTDWIYQMEQTPLGIHTNTTTAGPGGTYIDATNRQILMPNAIYTNPLVLQNTKLELKVTRAYEIKNNQQTPVYLNIWRLAAKDSILMDTEDTSGSYLDPLIAIDRDLANFENYNFLNETQNKVNPMFRLNWLTKGPGKGQFQQYFKITSHNFIKIQPGQLIKFIHTQHMHLPYNELRAALDTNGPNGTNRDKSFLAGRWFSTLFSIRGTIGRPAETAGNQAGYMPCDLQLIEKTTWKSRWHNNLLPNAFVWQDPILFDAGPLKATNIWNANTQAPVF